jgi:hypothetical protein
MVIKLEYFNSKSKRREGGMKEVEGGGIWGGKEQLCLAFIPPYDA